MRNNCIKTILSGLQIFWLVLTNYSIRDIIPFVKTLPYRCFETRAGSLGRSPCARFLKIDFRGKKLLPVGGRSFLSYVGS